MGATNAALLGGCPGLPLHLIPANALWSLAERHGYVIRKEDAELAQLEMQIGALLGKIALAVDSHQAS